MSLQRVAAVSAVLSFVAGCGVWRASPKPTSSDGALSSNAAAEASPAKSAEPKEEPSPVSLSDAMAPPSGVFDVRPIFGTDASTEKPALVAAVNAGMKAKELEGIFPGVSKFPNESSGPLELAKQGTKWIRDSDAKTPLKEQLMISRLEGGGLWRLDYTFDSAVVSDEFWMYAQRAAVARWGKPRGEIGPNETLVSFRPKTLNGLVLHRKDAQVRLEVDLRPPQ